MIRAMSLPSIAVVTTAGDQSDRAGYAPIARSRAQRRTM